MPLTLINPWYKDILAKYDHLKEVEIDDVYLKRELPVHLILGTSEYTRIKMKTTTNSSTYALWMDLCVFWKRTRLNRGISDPDIQI